jgi:hypothetical protein
MTMRALRNGTMAAILGTIAALLTGCISPPGTYPDPNGPRDPKGRLVDPHTGIPFPGQGEDKV